MEFPEHHKELILPVTVIVLSATFGLFSFFTRPPSSVQPLAVPPGPIAYVSDQEFLLPISVTRSQQEESGQALSAPEPTPVALPEWIVSDEPSTFYVVQETPLYACPDRECEVVTTLFPGVYWNLPYTLAPDGWFETNVRDTENKGYMAVSNLSTTFPNRCSLVLPYRVEHVGSKFIDEGFTREQLIEFVISAEEQVEAVIGRNILSYEEDAPNTVNFVISHFRDNEPFHRGLHTSEAVFPNGVVGQFWIGIYAALFSDVENWLAKHFIGPQHVSPFKEHYMRKSILHEIVHTTGFMHVDDPTAIMCGEPNCRPAAVDFSNEQLLTAADIEAIKDWCK